MYDVSCNNHGFLIAILNSDTYFARRELKKKKKKSSSSGGNNESPLEDSDFAPWATDATYTDTDKAMKLMNQLYANCDKDCYFKGSSWSLIFLMNGLLLMFLCCNMVCLCFGSRVAICRVVASACGAFLFLYHFGAILLTGVYRFSAFGQLCAINKTPTAWTSSTELPKDDFTYAKDASLILGLWAVQILTCVGCCLAATYVPMKAQK